MYKIQTLNKISTAGLDHFSHESYEVASEFSDPDAIVLRSFKMHDMELGENLKAIARAGAGTNNIPIDKCSNKGIVVFQQILSDEYIDKFSKKCKFRKSQTFQTFSKMLRVGVRNSVQNYTVSCQIVEPVLDF